MTGTVRGVCDVSDINQCTAALGSSFDNPIILTTLTLEQYTTLCKCVSAESSVATERPNVTNPMAIVL